MNENHVNQSVIIVDITDYETFLISCTLQSSSLRNSFFHFPSFFIFFSLCHKIKRKLDDEKIEINVDNG